ncbi:MAG: FkbM family methyltransferase [Deltaproteobacteria bacterium]|nr:FkbM family methyltransferase [Deltaproteobacteria bacterium]
MPEELDEVLDVPNVGPIHFDRRSREELAFLIDEVFTHAEYARHGIEHPRGGTIVDVGANIGLFTLDVIRRTSGDCRVVAIEPIPEILRYLERNVSQHQNVEIVRAGLTRLDGPRAATFSFYPGLPANSTQFPDTKREELSTYVDAILAKLKRENELAYLFSASLIRARFATLAEAVTVEVPLTTLAELRRTRHLDTIDLLKIDVEGAELDVLGGLDEPTWACVRQVVLETSSDRTETVASILGSRGFARVYVDTPTFAADLGLPNRQVFAFR